MSQWLCIKIQDVLILVTDKPEYLYIGVAAPVHLWRDVCFGSSMPVLVVAAILNLRQLKSTKIHQFHNSAV